jgi:hypothetical protein
MDTGAGGGASTMAEGLGLFKPDLAATNCCALVWTTAVNEKSKAAVTILSSTCGMANSRDSASLTTENELT